MNTCFYQLIEYQTLKKAEKDDDSVDRRAGRGGAGPAALESHVHGPQTGPDWAALRGWNSCSGSIDAHREVGVQELSSERSGQKIEQLKRGPEAAGPWGKGVLHPSASITKPGFRVLDPERLSTRETGLHRVAVKSPKKLTLRSMAPVFVRHRADSRALGRSPGA
ncbi:hypothetical protein MJT46_015707 [Ovis ammon polii x Ovis aries]|nr:hypothetical protein MJT46_015707 [Ovis ammon polii x Ovis aries]